MLTLEQAKVGMTNKVEQQVYDEFRRGSRLMELLTFDNAVSPGTGGSTLVYGYQRLKSPVTGTFRKLGDDYTPQVAKREELTTKLKIFGGSFSLDRVIINTAGAINELQFQLEQQVKAATNLFHYTVINGDSTANVDSFDGLKKLLEGSDTEITSDFDLTGEITPAKAHLFITILDDFLSELDAKPTVLMANAKMLNKIKAVARLANYMTQSEDAFGRKIDMYDGIELVNLDNYFDGTKSSPIIPLEEDGTSPIYAAYLGMDGFHGVSVAGDKIIQTTLPDMNASGTQKKGDVEGVMGVALKQTRKAGVLKGVQIAAAQIQ